MKKLTTVNEYFAQLNPNDREELFKVSELVKKLVPKATLSISYGMPVFKLNGHYLIGFAAFKNHLSVFPGAEPVEILKEQLKDYKTSKGTIQFTQAKTLKPSILKEIIKLCKARTLAHNGV